MQPLTAGGRVGPGEPADLALVLPRLGPVEMRSGHIPAPIGQ
ncbi:hypothetical protein [Azospirillum thermophilum]|nr:hypothetical protein [Azospirillum thermophilum]